VDHTGIGSGAAGSTAGRAGFQDQARAPVRGAAPLTVHQVDVFTRTPLAGNPAAVVLQADGLDDGTMQAIAQEMNLSETAFVSRESPSGVVPVRFFTPTREVPVCGHATLGAHFVRARHLGLVRGAVMQASPGARWHVQWERRGGATFVTMRQSPVVYGAMWSDDLGQRLLSALGIDRTALRSDCPVQIVSTGHAKVIVPLRSREILEAIQPDLTALSALSEATGIAKPFPVCRG
jgi:PhzF family phenazine biosynthesis protein